MSIAVSRRHFMGGLAAGLGVAGHVEGWTFAQAPETPPARSRPRLSLEEYDAAAKLSYNENPYGPSEPVLKAMTAAYRVRQPLQLPGWQHRGRDRRASRRQARERDPRRRIERDPAGRGQDVSSGRSKSRRRGADLRGRVRVRVRRPCRVDHPAAAQRLHAGRQRDRARHARNHRDVGFVYLCTPNNPTGIVVNKTDIRQLLDGVPEDVPVLIDEAYHHYVEHPDYATSIPYVLEGRNVIVTRTFSKIYGLAGMRLGYGIARRRWWIGCGRTAPAASTRS